MSMTKNDLKTLFKAMIFANIGIFIVLIALYYNGILDLASLFSTGKLAGIASVGFFLLNQLPGIFRRLELKGNLKNFADYLMFSRAQIGILMYALAFTHYFFNALFPVVIIDRQVPVLQAYSAAGVAALLIALPLTITSNNQSKKLLKKWWKKLHSLVYIMLWAIAIHVGLVASFYGFRELSNLLVFTSVVGVGILQIYSFIFQSRKKSAGKKV